MQYPQAGASAGDAAAAERAVATAQTYFDELDKLLPRLQKQLKAERAADRAPLKALREKLKAVREKRNRIRARIQALKQESKAIKQTIKSRKQGYRDLEQIDKRGEWQKLKQEILETYGPKIKDLEAKIDRRQPRLWKLQERVETLKQQLRAAREGVHRRPLAEDPRLVGLLKARKEAAAALATARDTVKGSSIS